MRKKKRKKSFSNEDNRKQSHKLNEGKMAYKRTIILLFFLLTAVPAFSQAVSGFYKIDDKNGELTKKVNIWGYVKNPGRYEVPVSTNLIQLIAIAGGPQQYALLDEVKVFRSSENGKQEIREVNVEEPDKTSKADLIINNEDTIIIDYSATVTWKDVFGFIYAPVALIVSVIYIADRIKNK